ncbi:MAG: TetR/AcrR family transcriptional regulator [Chloroflexota bacterium]
MSDLISLDDPLDDQNKTKKSKTRGKRVDAQNNRTKLLSVAQQLFNQQGIEAVTMMAIAETAGVGQGTLYRAFANKGELCVALLDADLRRFQQETILLLRDGQLASALTQLTAFLDRLVHFLDQHVVLMCEVQNYKLLGDEINHTGLHTWFYETVHRLLQAATAQNQIRADISLTYLTDTTLALLNPTLFLHQRQVQGLSVKQISDALIEVLMRGIANEGN